MNDPDRPSIRDAEPDVRRERDLVRDLAGREIDFAGELRVDLMGSEYERTRDDVVGVRVRGRGDQENQERSSHRANLARWIPLLIACGACHHDLGDTDSAFYNWDHRSIHCSVDIDSSADNDLGSIETGLDRAKDQGEVLELYMHNPGSTISWDFITSVLAAANARNLPYVTYADMAHGIAPTGGLALAFDDWYVKEWMTGRDMITSMGARLTFFIAHYDRLQPDEVADIQTLASDGHDIEAHSVNHLRGPEYVEAHGLDTWMADEIMPSIDRLRNDGYEITTYAYPFGSRTDEMDKAVLEHVTLLRSVAYTWTSPATDPCPY